MPIYSLKGTTKISRNYIMFGNVENIYAMSFSAWFYKVYPAICSFNVQSRYVNPCDFVFQ